MRPRGKEVEKRVGSALSAVSHSKEWKIPQEKRTGPQSEEKKSRRTSDCGVPHVHARQLREMLEHLDVACGSAVTSTNGERSMRPRGREVE